MTENQPRQTHPGSLKRVVAVLLVGVVLYFALALFRGMDKMGDTLARFHWSAFAFACGLAFSNYIFRFLKWEFYLARLKISHVPKFDSFLVFLSGFVLTVTPGKVGEVFKSLVLFESYGVKVERTAPIVVAERVTDLIGVIALIVIGSAGFSGGLVWAGVGAALVLALLGVIASRKLSLAIIAIVERLPGPFQRIGPKLHDAYESLSVLVSAKNLVVPTILSVVAWSFECLALWVILRGFGEQTPIPLCMFFYATSTLAGALIPVPGGLGVTEKSLEEQLLNLGHVSAGASTAAMILVRFATLWFAVLVGFVALSIVKRRHPTLLGGKPRALGETARASAPTFEPPDASLMASEPDMRT